jgi:hypothetical protein
MPAVRVSVAAPGPTLKDARRVPGQWLDGDDEAADGPAPRAKLWPIPKWTQTAYGVAALTFGVLVIIAFAGNGNVARSLVVAPVLAWITYAVAQRLAAADGQPAVVPILMGGLAVKFVGVLIRYWVGLQVYGRSDATEYVMWGERIAPGLRHFEMLDIGRIRGTNFIRLLTGIIFAVTPGGPMVGFFAYGFLSFVGMLFFWRAFKRAMPDIPDYRYLQVLMLLPSLVYWPSSIGKDAWMVLGMGVASYGVANILTNRTVVGWAAFLAGVYAVLYVRPHVGIALVGGLLVAELLRSRGSQNAGRAALSLGLLFVIGGTVMSTAAAFLGIENWSKANVESELQDTGDRTSEGRSEFTATPVNSPAQFPQGAFTVLFRPMPYETHSPQEFASSIENVVLLGALGVGVRRLLTSLRKSRRRPYLLFCLAAIVIFVVEYSSFSNFALIARQRTTVTALLLVFLCFPRQDPTEVEIPRRRAREPAAPGAA